MMSDHSVDGNNFNHKNRDNDSRLRRRNDISSSRNRTVTNPLLSSPMEALKNLQLVKVIGSGSQSIGFEGWYTPPSASPQIQTETAVDGVDTHNTGRQHVIVKIGRMDLIHYFDVEVSIIDRLLAENDDSRQHQQQDIGIPPVLMAIRGVKNPFREQFKHDEKKFQKVFDPDGKLRSSKISKLFRGNVVSVIVSPLLDHTINKRPRDFTSIYEMRTYLNVSCEIVVHVFHATLRERRRMRLLHSFEC